MKRLLIAVAATMLMWSCSSVSGPEKAARNFTENVAKGKVEEAKAYATESTAKMLDLANAFGGLDINPDFKFETIKDSIVDNKAWITYKTQTGDVETMEVVKIDGKWLVHMDSKK